MLYGVFLGMPCISVLVVLSRIRGFDVMTLTIGLYLYPVLGIVAMLAGSRVTRLSLRGHDPSFMQIIGVSNVTKLVGNQRYRIVTTDNEYEMEEAVFKNNMISGARLEQGQRYWISIPVANIQELEESGMSLMDRCRAWWQ